MKSEKRVFAHAYLLPEKICGKGCRVYSLCAVTMDGKEFYFEADQTRYFQSVQEIWDAFCVFCKQCGITYADEVWYSASVLEQFDGLYLPCEICRRRVGCSLKEYFDMLSDWSPMYMETEYERNTSHIAFPLPFDEFRKKCGYDVACEPYAGRELYKRYREEIGKESFNEEECLCLENYVLTHAEFICLPDPKDEYDEESEEMSLRINIALARLYRNAPQVFERAFIRLCKKYETASEQDQSLFFLYLQSLFWYMSSDAQDEERVARECVGLCEEGFRKWYDKMKDPSFENYK